MNKSISERELEILSSVNKEVAKKLSKVIATLLGKTVLMSFRKSSSFTLDTISAQFQAQYLCIPYRVNADISSKGVVIISKKIAILASELVMGKSGEKLPDELSAQHQDVCTQAFKKIIEAYAAALSQMLNKKFTFQGETSQMTLPSETLKMISPEGEWIVSEYGIGIEGFFEDAIYDAHPFAVSKRIIENASAKVSSKGGKIDEWNLKELPAEGKTDSLGDISLLLDTPLHLMVELGRAKMALKEILELGVGSIVELDKLAGEPVDIKVNNKLLAKGEVVVIDDNFGVRIINIVKPNERI